ncbi:hypothetical protein [Halobacillus kuroshimensis]|uniref:hypothetical protein n=1 Tax=Halobacillus kuroshimensis TaxID=302481 RepID=UPI0004171BB2|nr:hypothetical protein [Halobacillus kuroshimensis]
MKKNIYKKSIFEELVKRGHNFSHSMRNRDNPKYQVYVFFDSPELRKDLAEMSGKEYHEED